MRTRLFILGVACGLVPTAVRADVNVSTSLVAGVFKIQPAVGIVTVPTGAEDGFWEAIASVFATDALGGMALFDTGLPGMGLGVASAFASAGAGANSNLEGPHDEDAASNVNINVADINLAGFPQSSSLAELHGRFAITGTSGPVSVQFTVPLVVNQSLSTTGSGGWSASSQAIFNYSINGNPFLSYDHRLAIGPNHSALSSATSLQLTATMTLLANTPYFLDTKVDAESGTQPAAVPEPSAAVELGVQLGLFALFALLFAHRERRRPSHPQTTSRFG
jgi:hypothetical protein